MRAHDLADNCRLTLDALVPRVRYAPRPEPAGPADQQEIMMFLQALPTQSWGEKEMEILLSEACVPPLATALDACSHGRRFLWKSLFHNSGAHLRQGSAPAYTGIPDLNL